MCCRGGVVSPSVGSKILLLIVSGRWDPGTNGLPAETWCQLEGSGEAHLQVIRSRDRAWPENIAFAQLLSTP